MNSTNPLFVEVEPNDDSKKVKFENSFCNIIISCISWHAFNDQCHIVIMSNANLSVGCLSPLNVFLLYPGHQTA